MGEYLKNITALFKMINLNKTDAIVYNSVAKNQPSNMSLVIKEIKIPRATAYDSISKLEKLGLVSSYERNDVKFFISEDLNLVIDKIKETHQKDILSFKKAKSIVRTSKIETNTNTKVRYFKNINELINGYEDTLLSQEFIRAYANIEEMHKSIPYFFPEYYNRRSELDIFIKTISPNNQVSIKRQQEDEKEKREIRFVDKSKYNFIPEINLYDNKILISSWREKIAIIIESRDIVIPLKTLFDSIYDKLSNS